MNNLTLCLKNGIQLAIDKRGEIFITLNGYIKLSGKPKQTISERSTRAVLAGKVKETTDLAVPGRGSRSSKLIPVGLACEWLDKDNPELAKAVDGNLFGFLQEPIDLAQFHKEKESETGKNLNFSIELAQNLYNSTDDFPVELDDAWQWLGYSRKDKALEKLKSYFTENEDFTVHQTGEWTQGGRSSDFYRLTINCLKEFGMIARTEQGKLIRKYFLECERIAKTTIAEPKPAPQQPQLSSADRVKVALDLKSVLEFSEMDANPRFKQSIQDLFGDILGLTQNSLPAPDAPKWFGVAERAEQLGYSVALVAKHRSQLGKWVAERVGGSIKENRLCNGTQRPINVYPLSPELDEAIVSYLDQFA